MRVLGVIMALAIALGGLAAIPLLAETAEGCSWTGPDLDSVLDTTLPRVDLEGSLGSEVIEFLHEAGAPISFISGTAEDPEVRFRHPAGATIRDLLEDVMAQAPGYRLGVVDGKLVIYPFGEGYDELVDLGDPYKAKRASALVSVLRELRSKSPPIIGLRLPTFKSLAGAYGDLISVGGVRSVVEHLVSLAAGRPYLTFLIVRRTDGSMDSSLGWAEMIKELLIEAPDKVAIGTEFQVVPRVILADGTAVTLIGTACGVESEQRFDPEG
jgi:hypothetical protein